VFFEPFLGSEFCVDELTVFIGAVALTVETVADENAESSAVAAFTVSEFFLEPNAIKLLLEVS
jgi:hypothetical protein